MQVMPLSAGKERDMEPEQNKRMTKDAIIQELIALLNQNQQREAANNVFEMAALIDGMEQKLDLVTEELLSVRRQLERMEQEKANKSLKAVLKKSVDSLEQQCHKMKEQLFEIKEEVREKASEIVAEVKRKGKEALHKVSEFFGIRNKLESARDNVRNSIAETEHTIEKIDAFGGGMREAGQKIANTFRSFVDKETVDYSNKGKKFSKTEFAKKPFVVQKKLYESMEKHLDAAIDKVESLAMATRQEKQQEQPEISVDTEKEEVVGLGMVAEQEYQYGAEAFEAWQEEAVKVMSKSMENKELSSADRKRR